MAKSLYSTANPRPGELPLNINIIVISPPFPCFSVTIFLPWEEGRSFLRSWTGHSRPHVAPTEAGSRRSWLGVLSPQAVCGVTRVRDEMSEPIFSLLIPAVLLVNCSLTSREVFHGSEGGLGH